MTTAKNNPSPVFQQKADTAQRAAAAGKPGQLGVTIEDNRPHNNVALQRKAYSDNLPMVQKKGISINDSPSLEKEADVMGSKALLQGKASRASEPTWANNNHALANERNNGTTALQSAQYPIQRKKKQAANFIKENELDIDDDQRSVTVYIQNTSNPKAMRQGLLRAWNRNQKSQYIIATPKDLEATSTNVTQIEDLEDWDSENEDSWDLPKVIEKRKRGAVDLERSGKTPDKTDVPKLDFFDSIRLGRQVNKRDDYDRLPIVTEIGDHPIELDNPGTKDIYATPLDEVMSTGSSPKKKPIRKRFRRKGQSKDFNWKNLAQNLDNQKYKDPKKIQKNLFRFFINKGKLKKIDASMAEALGAIGSDFMKGSRGGRHFVRKAIRRIKANKKGYSFTELFTGDDPIYGPAKTKGGRAMVSSMHKSIEEDANRLLGVNNCLINAIARAAGLPKPNLGQVIRIREHFDNYGEMMVANQETINVIREVLGIDEAVAVIYQDRESEDFAGDGGPLLIYHVNGNHFTHQMPHNFVQYGSPKKKKK